MLTLLSKNDYLSTFISMGAEKFYQTLLFVAVAKLVYIRKDEIKGKTPELEYLACYEEYLSLYRRDGEQTHLELAKIFRRASHKIYRSMLKKKLTKINNKFLNIVRG